jgi:copper(I)-binding protein
MKLRLPLFLAVLLASSAAFAETAVRNAWVRATVGAMKMTAGYGDIVNTGPNDDELLSVSTSVSKNVHVHQTMKHDGMMHMAALSSLPIPAGATVKLAPGGTHVMITDISHPLVAGETIDMTYTFKVQGPVTVTAKVAPLSASQMPQ